MPPRGKSPARGGAKSLLGAADLAKASPARAKASPARAKASPARAKASPARAKSPAKAKSPARAPRSSPPTKLEPSVYETELKGWQTSTAPAAHSEYEFGGPLGAVAIIIFLPLVVYMLYFGCTKTDCVTKWSDAYELPLKLYAGLTGPNSPSLWSWKAFLAVFLWIKLHFILYLVLPGATVPGVKLADGSHLNYYINAHLAFWLCVAVFVVLPAAGLYYKEPSTITLSLVYDHYLELTSAAIAYSFAMAAYCYAASFRRGELLAAGGQTGNAVYDFFIGRALNPRIGMLDLKVACELRPGLIGWMLLNLGMAFKQYERDGTVTGSMIAVNLGQAYYVWDALANEQAILTTMDVTTDGFGFMLAFGDLAWVPFTYSLQVRARRRHRPPLARSCSPVAAIRPATRRATRRHPPPPTAARRRPLPPAAARCRLLVHATLTTIINATLTPRSPSLSSQARILVDHDPQLPWWALVLVLALNVLGLCIFRGANSEKDAFRRNPNAPEVAHLQFLPTKRGTRLLTSGWWGMARKINYTGDWLMGLSWCLTCGGASPVAYFYAIYFAVLLIHRAVRDDHFCSVKYGADWETYKQKVPAVFVPGII